MADLSITKPVVDNEGRLQEHAGKKYNDALDAIVARVNSVEALGQADALHTAVDAAQSAADAAQAAADAAQGTADNAHGDAATAQAAADAAQSSATDAHNDAATAQTAADNAQAAADAAALVAGQDIPVASGEVALTDGAATVNNASTKADSRIRLSVKELGGAPGALYVSAKVPDTSFTITSTSATDTSTVFWEVMSWTDIT